MAHFKKMSSDQLTQCVAHLSTALKPILTNYITDENFGAYFTASQVEALLTHYSADEITNKQQLCRDLIPLAQAYSVPVISSFYVGAIVLGGSGQIYFGANLEFEGLTLAQTVHAEQSAITNAWRHGESKIEMLAVSAPPCGHCRQFINELADAGDIDVLITEQQATSFSNLLPMAFGPNDLGINDRLMASPINEVIANTNDELVSAALSAAQQSYSPFSHSPSGLALKTSRGIYTGRYAENSAYNPSLSPLQGALIALHFSGDSFNNIQRGVLVELADTKISQQQTSERLLHLINGVSLVTVNCQTLS